MPRGILKVDYGKEVKEKWGNTSAYAEYATKTHSKDKQRGLVMGMENIFREFLACMLSGESPNSESAKSLVKKLQSFITENFYNCTDEILLGLGKMYVADERFKKNIDKYATGTAEYVSEAIACRFK